MRIAHLFKTLCVIAAAVAMPSAAAADAPASELTDAEFRRLQTLLQPGKDELWRTIPWKISVLDAQQAAAAKGKPIFIWAMDGHPLGCT